MTQVEDNSRLAGRAMNPTEFDRYLADLRERPLVIPAARPRGERLLVPLAGVLVGYGIVTGITGFWWGWILLAVGLAGEALWWFGIASDGACRRRYERGRVAAIHRRRRDLGIGS